jgi:transposase
MYVGVDTHKLSHTRLALDAQGQPLGSRTVANTPAGWRAALTWVRQRQPGPVWWGVENSGSLGKGFAQSLLEQGEPAVREVRPHRTAQYRRRGRTQDKTDSADALAMARLLLVEHAALPAVRRDDRSTELRLLSDHRDNLVSERTRLTNQLHAQMLQLAPEHRTRSGSLQRPAGVQYCHELQRPAAGAVVQARLLVVRQLAAQILRLDADIATLTGELTARVRATGTRLTELRGVGPVLAARLLGEVGCTPRIPSAAALAALAGIAPVAVASGGRQHHRVNQGGNRPLNRALYLIALCQRRWEPRAQAYYAKKRAEGKTDRAALRCLKRRLVDVAYRLLVSSDQAAATEGRPLAA